MTNLELVYPMFAMVALTATVGLLMLFVRIQSVRTGSVSRGYYKTLSASPDKVIPDLVLKTTRNFNNLFEVPVLFYAACLLAMWIPVHGNEAVFWAWCFVASRILHTLIHIGPNRLYPRILAYAICWISVMALWIQILMQVLHRAS